MQGRKTICTGVSWWNRPPLAALLAAEGAEAVFHEAFADGLDHACRTGAALLAWASKVTSEDEAAAARAGVSLRLVEDGFIRSVGLGAALARGGCFVIDGRGIYYDATRPSDLETLLESGTLDDRDIARAADLREAVLDARITKYNVGRPAGARLPAAPGRERVVVVGQVAVDAGVRRTISATIDVARSDTVNLALLEAARAAFPRAFIVYKPHPDVAAGLRPGRIARDATGRLADLVVADADIVDLIDWCDRLVTLSSLSGFEALLRGKTVTVHGMPFYAGWGLTEDTTSCPRRTRRLELDTLVAAALLRYCRYVDPVTLAACTAEDMVARLDAQRGSRLHQLGAMIRQHASWAGRRLGL